MSGDLNRREAREPLVHGRGSPAEPEAAAAAAAAPAADAAVAAAAAAAAAPTEKASFRSLFRYATPTDRTLLAVAVVAAAVSSCQTPAMSFFMADLAACIFAPPEERHEKVTRIVLTFLGIGIVGWILNSTQTIIFSRVADRMSQKMRARFFEHLMAKDVGWYDLHSAAEMATRLTQDTYDYRQGVGQKLGLFIQNALQSPMGIGVAFYRDWKFTLLLIVVVPVIGIVFGTSIKIMTKNLAEQSKYYAKAGGIAETTLGTIQTVAAFDGYERELAKYDEKLAQAERDGVKAGVTQGIAAGSNSAVFNGIFALGIWVGSLLMLKSYNEGCWDEATGAVDHCFNGSVMISVLFAVFTGGFGLTLAMQQMSVIITGRVAAARIFSIIDEPPAFDQDSGEELQHLRGDIVFSGVTFSYPTRPDSKALDNISYSIKAGTTAAFVGPSGSGKSTSIGLLMRYYDPSAGVVTVDGHDIRSLNLSWLRKQMALVQQEPVLFSGTIMSNILYGKAGATPEEARKAAKAANAHTFITNQSERYETVVGERGSTLSGGQKQRIAIARAMIRDPKVLLLDEATSALDTESERLVKAALDNILSEKSRTTLVVAHRLSTIKDAGVIFVLEEGRLVEQGSHAELLKNPDGLYKQLVQLQELVQEDEEQPEVLRKPSTGLCEGFGRTLSGGLQRQSSGFSPQLSGDMARQLSPLAPLAGGVDFFGEQEREKKAVLPEEDERETQVPTSRLWEFQKKNAGAFFTALIATIPMSAASPFVGRLFGNSISTLSMPPALPIGPGGKWIATFNQADIQRSVTETCISYGVLTIIQFASVFLSVSNFRRSSEGLTRSVRSGTFRAMLRQEMSYFDFRTSGDLSDRLAHEAAMIKSFAGESLGGLIQMFVTLIVAVGLSLQSAWQLTLTVVCIMPFMMIGQMAMMKAMKKQNETRAGPIVSEAMGNIRTVAAFGLQEQMRARYGEVLNAEVKEDHRVNTLTGIMQGYNSFMQFVLYGGVLFISSLYIDNLHMDPNKVFQVFFTLIFSMGGISQGATTWQGDKQKGAHAIKHIFNTIDRQPQIDAYSERGDKLESVRGEVAFVHVAFNYPSQPQTSVFVDFDLRIEAGTSVAFVGPSGSGKSTTVKLLQRFYDPAAGTILLDGHDIRTLNIKWLRYQMSLVQQEPVLFQGTILENIKYGKEGASDEEAMQAAKDSNAHRFIMGFPDGYQTDVGERGTQLSGGQKQRVAIARCVVRRPKVLLLDEATSALDTESERVVQEALDALMAATKRTTLVIAHRLSTIQNSDLICVVYQGKIVEKGTHQALMQIKDGQYKRLASRQKLAA